MSQRRQKRIDPPTDEVDGGYDEDEQSVVSEEESNAEQSVSAEESTEEGESGSDDEDEQAELEAEKQRIREALANVPLGQLASIQQKMGAKAAQRHSGQRHKTRGAVAGEDSTSESEEEQRRPSRQRADHTAIEGPKRLNKHRPVEMTSKRPVGRFRQVVSNDRKKTRDPRFERLSGHFNEDIFKKAYGFINEYQESEMQEMKKRLKKTKNAEAGQALRNELQKMESREAARAADEQRQSLKRRLRKEEQEKVKQGKKPFFLKRSEMKQLELKERYEELAKNGTGKLDRLLEKRRKRNAAKDRKAIPKRRRTTTD